MRTRFQSILPVLVGVILVLTGIFLLSFSSSTPNTFADEDETSAVSDTHHVIIFDKDTKMSIKTDAVTVSEVLERANIFVDESDIVDPALDTIIASDNFYINIYRAHPVVIIDGAVSKYLMTASYDPATIANEAGLTVYDGDEIAIVNTAESFLETGVTTTYKITRNGGRTITVEESIPFSEEISYDSSLAKGETRVEQVGEDGRKVIKYQVNFVDGVEVSRELISEDIAVQPTPKITVHGAKASISPEQETCANWARQAGVSEADLSAAIYLIYHESGCRVDAANPSGAYGIPQALPGNKMATAGSDWETNPVTQIRWMAGYVGRYGGWQGAYEFWLANHWY